jgi:quercetin dioxygenase-like cupin family protein
MNMQLEQLHQDARGDIYRVVLPGNRELMLFFCKAGYLRGGHSHDCSEMVILLSGKMRYHKWVNGAEEITDLEAGQVSINPAGVPHLGEFLEDSYVLDWKLGGVQAGGFVTKDFEPFRKLVRERMTL